ncbi:MAG TPA: ECF-type sigma factor [Polyangiaceae bacterium]|nr:ECF-type sigma factor [Polyangiaceae bacterium]
MSELVEEAGGKSSLDALTKTLYEELHKIASRYMRGERPGHTLRPTELVSEAYERLVRGGHYRFKDRAHFCGIVARVMRQVLVDAARKRRASKRGRGERAITFDDVHISTEQPENLIALDEALSAFARQYERKAKVVELFYFGGLTQEEITTMLGLSVNTVARDLDFAESWINRYLREMN